MKFRILMALASVLAIGCSHSGNGLSSFPAVTEKTQGKERAAYGKQVLEKLSKKIEERFGEG